MAEALSKTFEEGECNAVTVVIPQWLKRSVLVMMIVKS